MLLVDGMLGQMMEPVVMPSERADMDSDRPWALTGHGNARDRKVVRSLWLKPDELERSVEERGVLYSRAEKELVECEAVGVESADVVFVAFGSTARIVKDAMGELNGRGIKCGLIRPISLWPFPYAAFDRVSPEAKAVISVELSMGQLVQDVKLGVRGRHPVELIHRTGGILLSQEDVVAEALEILEVK
jgi:2-oxoglutarate ferredoxin oxidoreductase subunit alpha